MPKTDVVTRFAPSPTGNLHVGGARTALFNWVYARQHGGQFILRIEDTDRARSNAASTQRILADLRWLGLDWDQGPDPEAPDPYTAQPLGDRGPYFQSQRLDRYRRCVDHLLASGRAYKCFKTPQQLAAERDLARVEKRLSSYDPTESRSLAPKQIADLESQGKPCVVRFAAPEAPIEIRDEILGTVSVNAEQLEDFVILKSDGYPTYHLAVVVDDAQMGVTHVIRGQEHLNNAPKHAALQDALGFDRPAYAHIPLIFNGDGSKMSKRDKAKVARAAAKQWLQKTGGSLSTLAKKADVSGGKLDAFMRKKNDDVRIAEALAAPTALNVVLPEIDVDDFRRSGYLPEALMNYTALLGWSPGNDVERFDLNYMVQHFRFERVGKSNARFDRAKLLAFNAEAIADLSLETFTQRLRQQDNDFPHLTLPQNGNHPKYHEILGDPSFEHFAACYHKRSQTLEEPFVKGKFFVDVLHQENYDRAAVDKVLRKNNNQGFGVLGGLRQPLEACNPWTADALEQQLKRHAEGQKLSLNQIAQPLRVAVSGKTVSPPIFDTLSVLGRDTVLTRLNLCQELAKSHPQATETAT